MATWVRNASNYPSGFNADVLGTIELDNATAPGDFDPDAVNSVRIQMRVQIASGSFQSGGAEFHDVWNHALLTLNGNGTTVSDNNDTDGRLDDTQTTPIDLDVTDSSIATGFSIAQWEAMELNPGTSSQWTDFVKNMGNDNVTVEVATSPDVIVTIDYVPGAFNATIDQATFRIRDDDGSESAATWRQLEDINDTLDVDINFRIRFTLDDTTDGERLNFQPQLEYNLASGGWNDVTGASSVIRATTSSEFTDDDDTTRQLSIPAVGSFITPNSGMDDNDGLAGQDNDLDFVETVHDFVEVEFCFQIRSADVSDAQTVQLRIKNADSFGVTPTITINVPSVATSQAHFRLRSDDTAALNANGGGDWEAGEDISASMAVADLAFRVRFSVSVDAAITDGFQLRVAIEGGSYVLVPDEPDPFNTGTDAPKFTVVAIPSEIYADLDATTQLLTVSAGTFRAGDGNHDNTQAPIVFSAANDFTEIEWVVMIRKTARNIAASANVHNADGDTFDFRVYLDDGTALDTYDETPRVTLSNRVGHIGGGSVELPHRQFIKDKSGNLYLVNEYADLPTESAVAVMMKSTDGGDSWNPVGSEPASFDDCESVDMHYIEADDTIYIGAQLNSAARFYSFRVADHGSPDTWDLDESVSAATPGDQSSPVHWRDDTFSVHTNDNTCVMFYHDDDGNNRIRYRIRTSGGTWGSELTVDTEASTDIGGIRTVMDPADDTIHIFYHTWNGSAGEIWHKSLSNADVLSGRTQVDQGGPTINVDGGSRVGAVAGAVLWDDGGTKKIGVAYHSDGGGDDVYWNETAVSSINFSSGEVVALSAVDTNTLGGASVSAGVAIDDVDDEPYVFGTDLSATTANLKYDFRVSGSWQGDTVFSSERHKMPRPEVFVHSAGNGGARVVGFIHTNKDGHALNVGDGGTGMVRYDEIVLATPAAGSPFPPGFRRHQPAHVRM